ncbi:ABC transporter permease [Candidatus Hecatella orcuttiae]|uniref:ABC transporter permease n=1 Tax=Candidatus Hecatella orcuttiae TaxID=1935119 RepID=UPI002867F14E|nr:ABC transporter permease [Candidatus Hecatella orcuttiae]
MRIREPVIFTVFMFMLVIVWQMAVEIFNIPSFFLPPPSAIASELVNNLDTLLRNTYFTFLLIVEGFLLAVVFGFVLGVGIAYSWILRVTLYPLMVAIRSLPVVAIAPFFVIWVGYGSPSILLVSFFLAFFPIVIASISGLTKIDPNMLKLMRSFRASEWQILRKLRFKNALPYLFDGFKVSITLSVVGVVVGEFIASSSGVGYLVLVSNFSLNVPFAFASLLVLCILALTLYGSIVLLEKLLIPWRIRE